MQEFQELRVQLAKARLVQGTVDSLGARAETRGDVLQVPLYMTGSGKVSLSPGSPGSLLTDKRWQLREVPDLRHLKDRLIHLELSCVSINSVPGWLGELENLETLIFDGSNLEITGLPEIFGKLPKLRTLMLPNFRQMQTLPSSLIELTGLVSLRFSGPTLASLPPSLCR
jgi:Leucine-rich repeat (LRR) protein